MSIFRRKETNFFGKAKKTKTLAEPHQTTNGLLLKNREVTLYLFVDNYFNTFSLYHFDYNDNDFDFI
jgi:hypothetical protein